MLPPFLGFRRSSCRPPPPPIDVDLQAPVSGATTPVGRGSWRPAPTAADIAMWTILPAGPLALPPRLPPSCERFLVGATLGAGAAGGIATLAGLLGPAPCLLGPVGGVIVGAAAAGSTLALDHARPGHGVRSAPALFTLQALALPPGGAAYAGGTFAALLAAAARDGSAAQSAPLFAADPGRS